MPETQINTNDSRVAILAAIEIANQQGAFAPILTQAAMGALRNVQDSAAVQEVVADFKKLKSLAESATSQNEFAKWALSETANRYGIPGLIERAQKEEQIGIQSGRMILRPLATENVLGNVTAELIKTFTAAEADVKARAMKVMEGVYNIPTTVNTNDVIKRIFATEDLTHSEASLLQYVKGALDAPGNDPALIRAAVEQAVQIAKASTVRQLEKFQVNPLPSTIAEAIIAVKQPIQVPDFDQVVHKLHTGAATMQILLTMAGQKELSEQLGKGVQFIQGAAAVQKSLMMIGAASTGWGAALALVQMSEGIGAFGSLGLGGGAGPNDLQSAMAGLYSYLDKQFSIVNGKLDQVLGKLDGLIGLVQDMREDLADVLATVQEMNKTMDIILASLGNLQFYVLQEIRQSNFHLYRRYIKNGGERSYDAIEAACSDLVDKATRSGEGMQLECNDADATKVLSDAFLTPSQEAKDDGWRALNALKIVLARRDISISPPSMRHHPVLAKQTIDLFTELASMYITHFSKNPSAAEMIDDLTGVLDDLDDYLAFYRKPRNDGIIPLTALLQKYKADAEKIAVYIGTIRDNVDSERLTAYHNYPQFRRSNFELRYKNQVFHVPNHLIEHLPLSQSLAVEIQTGEKPDVIPDRPYTLEIVGFRWPYNGYGLGVEASMVDLEIAFSGFGHRIVFPARMKVYIHRRHIERHTLDHRGGDEQWYRNGAGDFWYLFSNRDNDADYSWLGGQIQQFFHDTPIIQDAAKAFQLEQLKKNNLERMFLTASKWKAMQSPDVVDDVKIQETVKSLTDVSSSIRAILKLAYPENYGQCDAVQGLCEGSSRCCLIDDSFLSNWSGVVSEKLKEKSLKYYEWNNLDSGKDFQAFLAKASMTPGDTTKGNAWPDTEIRIRTQLLEATIQRIVDQRDKEGIAFGLQVTRQRLENLRKRLNEALAGRAEV